MNDPVAMTAAVGATGAAPAGAGPMPAPVLDPSETRVFAELLRHPAAAPFTFEAGNLRAAAQRVASQLGGDGRTPADMVRSLQQSGLQDPLAFQVRLLEMNADIQAYFQRTIIHTSLANGAVNVVQGLLRNRE